MAPFGKIEDSDDKEGAPETPGLGNIRMSRRGEARNVKSPEPPEVHGGIGGRDKSEEESAREIFEGMALVNRDRGNVWIVESVTETSPGKIMVILRSKDDRTMTISKGYNTLVEILKTDGGAWRRE